MIHERVLRGDGLSPDAAPVATAAPPVDLALRFARRIIAEARTVAVDRGDPVPSVDWEAVKEAGDGCGDPAMAAARIIAAARQAAAVIEAEPEPDTGWSAPEPDVTVSAGVRTPPRDASLPAPPVRPLPRRRATGVATWTRNAGAIILLFVVWQLWGTGLTEHRAQSRLGHQFDALISGRSASTDGAAVGSGNAPPATSAGSSSGKPVPLPGTAVGRIQIPKIGVDQYVVQGTDESDLGRGPGHYIGTAMPGQPGNAAIAGHRTTYGAPFYRLGELAPGDIIVTTTTSGYAEYVVSQSPFAVSPDDIGVVGNFGDNRLTLTTCNPIYSATQRLIVVARLVHPASWATPDAVLLATKDRSVRVLPLPATGHSLKAPADVAARSTGPLEESNTAGIVTEPIGWHFGALPFAFLAIAIVVGLGLGNQRLRRLYGAFSSRVILIPVWAAALYLLCIALSELLPANL